MHNSYTEDEAESDDDHRYVSLLGGLGFLNSCIISVSPTKKSRFM